MSFDFFDNPIEMVDTWLKEAKASETSDYNAAALSTLSINGKPQVRMVLIKSFNEDGATFFTNLESQKGQALLYNNFASICFHWKSLKKQIRVEGEVKLISDELADKYFETRSRASQIGAWASSQSKKLENRQDLLDKVKSIEEKFQDDRVRRPSFWSGFCLSPNLIEFWKEGDSRLHDRIEFTKTGKKWNHSLLYP
ncbi:MAG: Pyridoxine/pyridoxamine 5'-phosphate oxidase [Alphaproteobacteria bacterium MarineAlpha2_Bin1]|nr:MAG: Pyridoxine/pyridoxamine 5'-phosphate oxidase [Alphaproteobacteria bacterium MarineAlpha2_Bin1]